MAFDFEAFVAKANAARVAAEARTPEQKAADDAAWEAAVQADKDAAVFAGNRSYNPNVQSEVNAYRAGHKARGTTPVFYPSAATMAAHGRY